MKILHFITTYMEGCGTFYYLQKLVKETACYGIDHAFLSCIKGKNVPLNMPISFIEDIDLVQYISENKPDIIHFHDVFSKYIIEKTHMHEAFYKLIKNIPSIRTIHDYSSIVCPTYFNEGHEKGSCNTVLNPQCKGICLTDESFYEPYMNYIKSLENYASISYFSSDTDKRIKMYNHLSIANKFKLPSLIESPSEYAEAKENILLFAGRMVRQKGLEYLFDALSKLKNKDWTIYMAGEQDAFYYRYLYKMAFKSGFHDRIKFMGLMSQRQLFELYKMVKVMVFPSIGHETFGMSGAEAVAYGIPVVAFDVDGISEWLEDGVNGRIVDFKNTEMFAWALDEILGNDITYSNLKAGAISKSQAIDYNQDIRKIVGYYYSLKN